MNGSDPARPDHWPITASGWQACKLNRALFPGGPAACKLNRALFPGGPAACKVTGLSDASTSASTSSPHRA